MHEALDARLQLHEGAVVGDVGDAADMARPDRELRLDAVPRIGLKLLHAERDALGVLVDLDDLDLHRLADPEDLGGMVHTAPGHVGHVQQTVDTAEIDEGAVFGDVLHDAVDHVAFLQAGDHLGALLGTALFENGAARDHDVAAAAVHLEDLEGLRHVHERAGVAHGADIDLGAGQERDRAAEIDGEATLDAAEDRALDALFLLERLLEAIPGSFAPGLVTAQDRFATGVLDALEIDLDRIAHLDLGGLAGSAEFLEVDAAFHLVADIDDGLTGLDREHGALDHGPLVRGHKLEALVEQRFEIFHCRRS